jgi:hypothetical protein
MPRFKWARKSRGRAVHAFPLGCVSLCGRVSNLDEVERERPTRQNVCFQCANLVSKWGKADPRRGAPKTTRKGMAPNE